MANKMFPELKSSNLIQIGDPEADSAKALLKATVSNTRALSDIVQRLKSLELEIHNRATQVTQTLTLMLILILTLTVNTNCNLNPNPKSQR